MQEQPEPPARSRGLVRIWFATFTFVVALQGIVPMFPFYRERFGLSEGDLTLVFAMYSLTLIPTLLLQGPLSDARGRKTILLPTLGLAVLASLVMASANGLPWLIVGRVLQGLSTGAFWGAGAAFARDLTPDHRRDDAALLFTVTFPAGLGVGAVGFGAVASATDSIVVPWLVHAVMMVAAALLVSTVPETVRTRRPWPRLSLRIGLPRGNERGFLWFVAPLTFVFATVQALALALAPTLLGHVIDGAAPAQAGLMVGMVMALAVTTQLATRNSLNVYQSAVIGGIGTVSGGLAVAASILVGSVAMLLPSMALLSMGSGLAFRGVLSLSERMSPEDTRAEVLSACTALLYLGAGLPTLASGYLIDLTSLGATIVGMMSGAAVILVVALLRGRAPLGEALRSPT